MAEAPLDFATWLDQADIPQSRLTPRVLTLLQAVFSFRQRQGFDYFSTRLLSHFLLNCDCGLKVAHVARLVGISRPTASGQQGLSSKQAIQQAHHRLDGRPYGKLLPRYTGAIAAFLVEHPDASRAALLDFIDAASACASRASPCTSSSRSTASIASPARPPQTPRRARSARPSRHSSPSPRCPCLL